jgi:hypothetical protein
MVGEIAATSPLMFCFKSTIVLGLFSYTLLVRYPQLEKSQALKLGGVPTFTPQKIFLVLISVQG